MASIIQRLRNFRTRVNRALPTPAQVIGSGATKVQRALERQGDRMRARGFQSNVVPIALGGAAAAGYGAAKVGLKGAKTVLSRVTTNPFAGMGAKQVAGRLGAGALGGAGALVGFKAAQSYASGEEFNAPSGRDLALTGIAGAFATPFVVAGVLTVGAIPKTLKIGKSQAQGIINQLQGVNVQDAFPQVPNFNFDFGGPIDLPSELPLPTSGVSAAYAPSVSIGGFQPPSNDLLPLLLLLLGGGAGFAIGRKRKKKKKKTKKNKKKRRK